MVKVGEGDGVSVDEGRTGEVIAVYGRDGDMIDSGEPDER